MAEHSIMNTEEFRFSDKNSDLMVWSVGQLCLALANLMDQHFNPVQVKGEITGFMRAASGHCYFSLKDGQGQIRCAMFKRASSSLRFNPKDGDLVELKGKIDVYSARGDLQLIVETMKQAGMGNLYEQFLLLKAQLEQKGLFDKSRKRVLPMMPKAIGLITSLGAAALRDVATTLARRVPHIKVVLSPAAVQGANAPQEIMQAFDRLEAYNLQAEQQQETPVELILLVRGGGSIEDLWSFNNEELAYKIANSSVPVVSGVGHETDFTIADFVADVRAATPTAAAEIICESTMAWQSALLQLHNRMSDAVQRRIDQQEMNLDRLLARLGRPSNKIAQQNQWLSQLANNLKFAVSTRLQTEIHQHNHYAKALPVLTQNNLKQAQIQLEHCATQLKILSPQQVITRGYARLENASGQAISSVTDVKVGQKMTVLVQDGQISTEVLEKLFHTNQPPGDLFENTQTS